MNRILITGAAGRIGSSLREGLRGKHPIVRVTDIRTMAPARQGEEVVQADLHDFAATVELMNGVDAVIHLAAIPDEASFDEILETNMIPTYNVFEAARLQGVKRVVFTSSIHAVGLYPNSEIIGTDVPSMPDSFYGVSKVFGEGLGIMYANKFGLQVVSVRICSFEDRPKNRRHLSTWISPRDTVQLFDCCLQAPDITYTVVYGISNNSRQWFDNSNAEAMGYDPQDNGETYADEVIRATPERDPENPADTHLGGVFALPSYTADKQRE